MSVSASTSSSKRKIDGEVKQDKPVKKNKSPNREYADDEFVHVTIVDTNVFTSTMFYIVQINKLPGGNLDILEEELEIIGDDDVERKPRAFREGKEVPCGTNGADNIIDDCLKSLAATITGNKTVVLPESVKVVAFLSAARYF